MIAQNLTGFRSVFDQVVEIRDQVLVCLLPVFALAIAFKRRESVSI
jgi:hypothetical protein